MRQVDQVRAAVEPGTLMQKAIPPRLVEPYLTGRRAVIAGFVFRLADSDFSDPADYLDAMDLRYDGSVFDPNTTEIYVLRWPAVGAESYRVPLSSDRGGDWSGSAPFTGTGFTSSQRNPLPEFYLDPVPVPVGAEIYRITWSRSEFIARYDGQAWLRPAWTG